MITFLSPERLWLLAGVLALVAAYLSAQRRRRKHAVRFAALPLLARVAPRPGWRRHLPAVLFAMMAVLLVGGFARPQADVRVPREQATVIVALDTSGSMRADDISPDRFSVAQDAAREFVDSLPAKYRVGFVPFGSAAQIAVPPTIDRGLLDQAIDSLTINGATAIGDAIATSVEASQRGVSGDQAERIPARIVLLSDGENSRGRPVSEGIAAAVAAGVPVSTIAYGTDEGTIGGSRPVPVDRETLAQIAEETDGQAYEAGSAKELDQVYKDLGSSIGYRIERQEVTSWFVGFGLVAALLAALTSLRFTGRLP